MPASTVFLFSGQGSQHYQMGKVLFEENEVFRARMQQLDEIATDVLGESVLAQIYHPKKLISTPFLQLRYSHPALFMVQYAIAEMLMAEGIQPDALLGTSLGEFVAAAVAKVLPADAVLTTLIKLAVMLEQRCPPGAMLAILEAPEFFQKTPELHQHSELAAIGFDKHFVIAGTPVALSRIEKFLRQREILSQPVTISLPFHSSLLEKVKTEIIEILSQNQYQTPQLVFISSVFGQPITELNADYLWQVGRKPIDFRRAIMGFEKNQSANYLDLGPSATLATYARFNLSATSRSKIYPGLAAFGVEKPTRENFQRMRSELLANSNNV